MTKSQDGIQQTGQETVESDVSGASTGRATEEQQVQLEPANFDEDIEFKLNDIESYIETIKVRDTGVSILKQEYLDSVLPHVLEGLSWVIKERPNDPVEHLAMFLLGNSGRCVHNEPVESQNPATA